MGRAMTQTPGRAFQTLDRAFSFFFDLQKLAQVLKKLSRMFQEKTIFQDRP